RNSDHRVRRAGNLSVVAAAQINDVVQIEVRDLTMSYGGFVVQRDLNFRIHRGEVFVIMGDSGSGKSTLLRHMIGLQRPQRGDVLYSGASFWNAGADERERLKRGFGV